MPSLRAGRKRIEHLCHPRRGHVDEHRRAGGYFNVVHVLTDETGRFAGTRSMHCYPVVSEDGTSFADDGSKIRIYVRDESNSLMAILGEDGNSAPISAVRMSPGSPGFPGPTGSPAEV